MEKKVYQWVALICFCLFIGTALKYDALRGAYKDCESCRVEYCKQNKQLKTYIVRYNQRLNSIIQQLKEDE